VDLAKRALANLLDQRILVLRVKALLQDHTVGRNPFREGSNTEGSVTLRLAAWSTTVSVSVDISRFCFTMPCEIESSALLVSGRGAGGRYSSKRRQNAGQNE